MTTYDAAEGTHFSHRDVEPMTGDLTEDGIAPDELRGLFRDHPSGVALITADSGSGPVAMTASSLFSVSAAPALIVFSAAEASSSTPALLEADTVVIHLLDEATHDLAILGATSGIDRFADRAAWARLATNEPYFLAPERRIRARVVKKVDAGAATLFVVHALESSNSSAAEHDGRPLVYHNRTWHVLGDHSRLS
ncbi:flavin reductase family protein [Agromyces sp. SYSU T00266]|uniref:flavin reductase family protein n=1 Tax=Agromyces zhanjiangensis TaxID=3158562 RepID=UPI00339B2286